MTLETIKPYLIIVGVWLIVIVFALIMIFIGGWFIRKSIKRNRKNTNLFLNSIWAGITGGIVVAMFLDLKSKEFNIFSYILILALIVLFIGMMTSIAQGYFPKIKKKIKQYLSEKSRNLC